MAKNQKTTKKGAKVPHKVLSDRGLHLEKSQQALENSNIFHGRSVIVGQNDNGEDVVVKIGQECPKCHKRVRGPNHAEGTHHRGTVAHRSYR